MISELLAIQIENTNICNAHCKFCPHDKFKPEDLGIMDMDLYKEIVDQASKLPNLQVWIPMLTGEPFCDKGFIEKVEYARSMMEYPDIEIYTNMSLADYEDLDRLKGIGGIRLNVSLNGVLPQTREKIMGLSDYFNVLKKMKYCENIGLPYRTSCVAHPDIKREELAQFIKDGGICIQYQSWCGEQYPYKRNRWTSCVRAMNYLTILQNGEVNLCCFDPFGKVYFGDLKKETIEEIWESEKRKEYRMMHKQGRGNELLMCQNCTEG